MRDAQRLSFEESTTGGDDVLDDLERDHRRVEQLFARAGLVPGAERLVLVAQIVQSLELHASIEEDIVYPAVEKSVGGGDVLDARSREDHEEIKELLARVGAATADDVQLTADLRALQLVVQSHVAIEEGEVFPALRAAAGADALAKLTTAAQKARTGGRKKTERKPPAAAPIGAVDALRDLVPGPTGAF